VRAQGSGEGGLVVPAVLGVEGTVFFRGQGLALGEDCIHLLGSGSEADIVHQTALGGSGGDADLGKEFLHFGILRQSTGNGGEDGQDEGGSFHICGLVIKAVDVDSWWLKVKADEGR